MSLEIVAREELISVAGFSEKQTAVVLELDGDLYSDFAPHLGEELDHLIDGGYFLFVIVMEKLRYISSESIRELTTVLRRLAQPADSAMIEDEVQPQPTFNVFQPIRLADVPHQIARTLTMGHLTDQVDNLSAAVPMYETVAAALNSFAEKVELPESYRDLKLTAQTHSLEINTQKTTALEIFVDGNINSFTIEFLARYLNRYLNMGITHIILNLKNLNSFSSAIVRPLIPVLNQLEGVGTLVISEPTPKLLHDFELVGLDQFFDMYPNTEAALAALAKAKRL